ncbi:MAG: tetratricopeptide repeat protein [Rikenellaceae bacterium]
MKKLLLSIVVLFAATTVVLAQSDVKALMIKLEKSNAEIKDPKKMEKASTWVKRGDIYKALGEANYDKVFVGQPVMVLVAAIGQPTNAASIPVEKIDNQMFKVYQYPTVKVFIDESDNVAFFEEAAPAIEKPFVNAVECYKKALEVEPSQSKLVAKSYEALIQATLVNGNNKFSLKKYAESYDVYDIAAQLRASGIVPDQGVDDIYFQLARTAMLMTDFPLANKNLDILVGRNFLMADGTVLYFSGAVKSEIKGLEKEAEAIFVRGMKEFPDNKDMLQGLVNLYVRNGEPADKVIPYIKQAEEKDPKNVNIVIQEGNAYVAMEDYLTAISAYERALTMTPNFFDALYNKGYAYYKLSDKAYKDLNTIDYTNVTATNAKKDEVLKYRKASVEVLEQALIVNPKSKNSAELLRALCFALRDEDPIYMEKYNKYNEINKTL